MEKPRPDINLLGDYLFNPDAQRIIESVYPQEFTTRLEDYKARIIRNDNLSDIEKGWILRAIRIAEYGHDTQVRKREVNGEKYPYVFHNLEMSERALDDGIDDPLLHVLIWLHDVPEDAPKYHQGTSSLDWIKYIDGAYKEELDSYTWSPRGRGGENITQAVALGEMLQAITSADIDVLEETRQQGLRRLALYEAIKAYVSRGGLGISKKEENEGKISSKSEKRILETVFNLKRIFNIGLSSPTYYRLFLVKMLDVWHNFKDPDLIREDKALRGIIAANLAHLFGWYSLESEIVEEVLLKVDIHTPNAAAREKDNSEMMGELREQFDEQKGKIIKWWREKRERHGFPFSLSEEIGNIDETGRIAHLMLTTFLDKIDSTLNKTLFLMRSQKDGDYPVPRFIEAVDHIDDELERKILQLIGGRRGRDLSSDLIFSWLPNKLAGNRLEKVIYVNGNNHSGFVLHFRSREAPLLLSLFRSADVGSFTQIAQLDELFNKIPESGIFDGSSLKKGMLDNDWKYHVGGLLTFLFEPNDLIQHQRRVVPLLYNGQLIIARGGMKIGTLIKALGVQNYHGSRNIKLNRLIQRVNKRYWRNKRFILRCIEISRLGLPITSRN